jgi:chemotaxis protein MotB
MAKKEKQKVNGGGWINTYSDMMTLMLCFFVVLFNPDESPPEQLAALAASMSMNGMGSNTGGMTLSQGRLADLGNTINSLPSMERGKFLGTALKKAVSLFNPEIKSNKVKVTSDERGLVITLASDAFFSPASAVINIEATRDILLRLAQLLASPELKGRKFRIEGHTDTAPTGPPSNRAFSWSYGPWPSNWDLSCARATAVLRYLVGLGIDEHRFQVAGFGDTVPVASNSTPEGRAYNRRVDVIVLDEGHL